MKKILLVLLFYSSLIFGYTNINTFDSGLNGWTAEGSPNDFEKMVPGCTNYPHEYYPSWNMMADANGFMNGSLKVFYTNRKNFGSTTVSIEFVGDDEDFGAYKYLMVYVKGGNPSDFLNIDLLENNSADSNGPWGNADDIWDCELGPWGKTNWYQIFLPINTDNFISASEGWNSICEPTKFRQINNKPTLTNLAVIQLAIASHSASPTSPKIGVAWFDNFIFLEDTDLIYASNPQPALAEPTTNVYQPITLDIGANKSNVRMIVNDIEYKTNDSHLTYDGNTLTFIPTVPFSEVVNVYVDAIDTTKGVPMVAKKWWFFIGQDTKSDTHLIKNLKMPNYFKKGNSFEVQAYVSSEGSLDVALYGLSGNKIGTIKSYDNLYGDMNFFWDGKINGKELSTGLYLIEFKYASPDGTMQRRRVKTIQIIR